MLHKHKDIREVVTKHDIEIVGVLICGYRKERWNRFLLIVYRVGGMKQTMNIMVHGGMFESVVCIAKDEQQITMEFTKIIGESFIVVYASIDIIRIRELWNALIGLDSRSNSLWIALGDCNSILSSQERVGGAEIRSQHFANFFYCVNFTGLTN